MREELNTQGDQIPNQSTMGHPNAIRIILRQIWSNDLVTTFDHNCCVVCNNQNGLAPTQVLASFAGQQRTALSLQALCAICPQVLTRGLLQCNPSVHPNLRLMCLQSMKNWHRSTLCSLNHHSRCVWVDLGRGVSLSKDSWNL